MELENKEETKKIEKVKNNKIKKRTLLVFAVLIIFAISISIIYRANYLEILEIGTDYVEVFNQDVRYKLTIGVVNFIIVLLAVRNN